MPIGYRTKRHRLIGTLLVAIATLLYLAGPVGAAPSSMERLAGEGRIETAIAVSQELWESAGSVVLARADDFPDALAAGPLAGYANGPILLTDSDALDPVVAEEILRLGAQQVYLVGGEAALSSAVHDAVAGLATPVRLSGGDRYETADAVADEIAEYRDTGLAFSSGAFVSGAKFPDALAAMNVPGFEGDGSDAGPDYIALTPRNSLPDDNRVCDPSYPDFCIEAPPPDLNCDELGYLGPADPGTGFTVVGEDPHGFDTDDDGVGCEQWSPFPPEEVYTVVGGEAVVSGNVERQLGYGPDTVERIAGADRFQTAALVLEAYLQAREDAPGPLFVATGDDFPDALGGGAALAETDGYLALVGSEDVPDALATVLQEHVDAFTTVYVLGGEGAVSAEVETDLAQLFGVSSS